MISRWKCSGVNWIFSFLGVLLLANLSFSGKLVDEIHLNQFGYTPTGPKVAMVGADAQLDSLTWSVNYFDSEEEILSGTLIDVGLYASAKEYVYQVDFSELQTPGTYFLNVPGFGKSYPFVIAEGLAQRPFFNSVKSFYYLRAGMELEADYAEKWFRPAGHTGEETALLFEDTGNEGEPEKDLSGGWYDAGDYGKYLVNGGYAVSFMLTLWEVAPNLIGDNALNIPESGNGVDDYLDELRYELEFFQKMQDTDGGVFFKVAGKRWAGFVMPHEDTPQRYAFGKSTASTLNFAASLAQAARIYASIDSAWSAELLQQAEDAWDWAVENPSIKDPSGVADEGSGGYGDGSFSDEFLWAAANLYATTQKTEYMNEIYIYSNGYNGPPSWQNVKGLAYYALAFTNTEINQTLRETAEEAIVYWAERMVSDRDAHPYRIAFWDNFNWGSNGEISTIGAHFMLANKIQPDTQFVNVAYEINDYMLGKNPNGYSFLSGIGSKHVMKLHHRQSGADDVNLPVPGLLSGGPNGGPISYGDDQGSYEKNENAINWSAAYSVLTGLLFAEQQKSSDGYSLNVYKEGNGYVKINSEDYVHAAGTKVRLTAVPGTGYVFAGWEGASESKDESIEITINKNEYINALFELDTNYLRVYMGVTGKGKVLFKDTLVPKGTEMSFTPVADPGYYFSHWGQDIEEYGNEVPITLSIDSIFYSRAYFLADPDYNLIQNGRFNDGYNHWTLETEDDSTATTSIKGKSSIVITPDEDTKTSEVQLTQEDINLIYRNTYTVSFQAKTNLDSAKKINVYLRNAFGSYMFYGTETFELNQEMTEYSFDIDISKEADAPAKIYFAVGGPGNAVITDISIKYKQDPNYTDDPLSVEAPHKLISTAAPVTLHGGTLVLNSNVDQLQIFDIAGKIQYKATSPENQHQVQITELEAGIYFVRTLIAGKSQFSKLRWNGERGNLQGN